MEQATRPFTRVSHKYDSYAIGGSGIGGGGGGCFVAGTVVWTPDGGKPIETLGVGDSVVSFTPKGDLVASVVESIHVHEEYLVNRYTLWGDEFVATPNHHVLTENNAYKALQDFRETECLVDALGELRPLLRTEAQDEPVTVYNIIVATWHNYLVGNKGIRVSNGGGGKKGGGGKDESDAYKSNSTAYIVELLSAGAVEGIVGGLQGIFLNDTPVQNTDGSLNFKNFQYDFRPGTQYQAFMPGYSDEISSEVSVDIEVKQAIPVSRTVISSEVDGIRVRVALQQQKYEDDGDVVGMTLHYRVFVKQGGGAFELRVDEIKQGRFSSLTEYEYYLPVNNFNGTVDQFTVRVEKVTADVPDGDTKEQQIFKWTAYTEVIETKLNYAHSAIVGEQFNPKDFASVPSRKYKLAGILVQVPSNATVNATNRGLDFSGTWDGTFYTPTLACRDPAWIAYYLLTDPINGLGRYIDAPSIDKWSLYRASIYNNEYVSDGLGGLERRFSCDVVLQQREDAWKLLEAVFSVFNCSHYWADGTVFFVQDRPLAAGEEYDWQFTQADIEGGQFVYGFSALRSRSSIALITWNDPSDFYSQTVEPVEDREALARYGYREIEFAAFGCTSRGQAIRKGRYVLFSNHKEVQTVTFSPRSFAAYVRPGDIVQIADAKRAAIRYGGLISDATTTSVTLDASVAVLSSGYRITCMMPNGTLNTRNVTNSIGNHSALTVDTPFSATPLPESNWVVSAPNVNPQLFRVISNSIDAANPTKHVVTASQYVPDKYNYIENGWQIRQTSTKQTIPTVVTKPRTITLQSSGINGAPTLIVSWLAPVTTSGSPDPFTDSYQVEWSRDKVTWQQPRIVTATSVTYENVAPGVYYARVQAIDVFGKTSDYVVSGALTVQIIQVAPKPITTETQDFTNPGNSSGVWLF